MKKAISIFIGGIMLLFTILLITLKLLNIMTLGWGLIMILWGTILLGVMTIGVFNFILFYFMFKK